MGRIPEERWVTLDEADAALMESFAAHNASFTEHAAAVVVSTKK